MAHLFEKVLYATDLSPVSEKVFLSLADMGVLGVKEARLLYVLDKDDAAEGLSDVKAQARGEMARKVEHLISLGITADMKIREGVPAREIVDEAARWGATLILMGSVGHGFVEGLLVGSVSSEVVRTSRTPVLVERLPRPEGGVLPGVGLRWSPFRKVLFPLELTEASAGLPRLVNELTGRAMKHAVLVHIVEKGGGHVEGATADTRMLDLVNEAEARLGALAGELKAAGVEAFVHVHEGHAARDINLVAEEEKTSMIIMRAGGKGGTAARVLKHARTPVLFFP